MKFRIWLLGTCLSLLTIWPQTSVSVDTSQFWLKVRATNKFERSVIANTGAAIQLVKEDYVIAIANFEEKKKIEDLGWVETSFSMSVLKDFPAKDSEYNNYTELTARLQSLAQKYPQLTRMTSAGKSTEGRDIWSMRISGHLDQVEQMPGAIFMGGHHAREHLSVETPLRIMEWMLEEYTRGNDRIRRLIDSRDIHFIPAVNPDGLEYDVASGQYRSWRKNRSRNANGTYGVDLNRNYGHGWGTGGSSTNPSSDTYMGIQAFSEPETQAIKKYVEDHQNITVLLTFHTFSELILYPWGGKYDPIADQKDHDVHVAMAKKMATWNNYTPEQASDLYVASGDTTDWAYGEHKIFSFTFELDPADSFGNAGFYPGAAVIPEVVNKNKEPVLYMIELADNPYRVLEVNGAVSTR